MKNRVTVEALNQVADQLEEQEALGQFMINQLKIHAKYLDEIQEQIDQAHANQEEDEEDINNNSQF